VDHFIVVWNAVLIVVCQSGDDERGGVRAGTLVGLDNVGDDDAVENTSGKSGGGEREEVSP
jgi:hypothetical protein